ncbi:hypothetical protein M422DRAFT_252026 [Sphaerobolus stellatus SS14]|uniref:Uncharacterized protein n=1 Tax=Sphaerobolus stellatus (strain SS14) TaxID=990650 RepID=A0A0C9VQ84_SPHS4|nr:hypothetical protein M422DRAFT_252026 [Sphaerobolus stellatus SS14]
MVELYYSAKKCSSRTARDQLLRSSGLHYIKNSFWHLSNSDPYVAYSYDILHALDSGEWRKHQWPLLLEILTPQKRARLSKNMDRTPHWRGLKHFKMVASADFTDGNSYKDILKQVTRLYSKNFNYPKHHSLVHFSEDLRAKRVTENYSTHPGEGFQQEVQQAYDQTNFRDNEPQVVRINENQEVIARIRMYVDLHDKENQRRLQELDESDGGHQLTPTEGREHWAIGSPLKPINVCQFELSKKDNPAFRHFTRQLTDFLQETIGGDECPQMP